MVTDRFSLDNNPFCLDWAAPHPALQSPTAILARSVEHLLQLSRLNRLYGALKQSDDSRYFPDRALDLLNVRADTQAADWAVFPRHGPVVVVANHPSGVVEGLLLMRLLHSIRPDCRVLLNALLDRVPECHDFAFFVNPFGGPAATQYNRTGMKSAFRWLHDGGVLLVFPAGEVARMNWSAQQINDPPWNANIARMIRLTNASMVPIHVHAANSPLFHLAGWVHPRLQTALLPQELLKKRNSVLRIEMGRPIPSDRIQRFESDATLIRYLRLRVDTLACRPSASAGGTSGHRLALPARLRGAIAKSEPIAPPIARDLLRREITALPRMRSLLSQGSLRVIVAPADEIPQTLLEIGRLREMTFRGVGEGTGQTRDLDEFDAHYLHLFVWNDETADVIGAYRMGPTDRILARLGLRGLYTHTLFKYRQPLIDHLNPALELGRSFVRPEHQRAYLPLLLLWKGVAHYLALHPQYRKLFGPVSISNSYHPITRHLIERHFPRAPHTPELTGWVRPRRPLRRTHRARLPHMPLELDGHLETLTDLIEDLEPGQSLPVLLKQYLKLGGEVIAFNVDPAFNFALDALIVVDVEKAGATAMQRYMGPENWARFMQGPSPATPHGCAALRM